MTFDPSRIPTDAEIAEAQRKLEFAFPPAYVEFLKGGSNVANAVFEPAVILPGSGHLDIFEIAETAWAHDGVPREWLPFVEDNGDYFLISGAGEVRYWSHNGATNERWASLAAWFQQVCVEMRSCRRPTLLALGRRRDAFVGAPCAFGVAATGSPASGA